MIDLQNKLKLLNAFTDTAVVSHPTTFASFDTADGMISIKHEDEFPEFALIENVHNLLRAMSTLEEPEINFGDGVINMNDEQSSVKFITDAKNFIKDASLDVQFERTKQCPETLVFELSAERLKQLRKATDVFKEQESITIKSEPRSGVVDVSLRELTSFSENGNSFSTRFEGKTSDNDLVAISFNADIIKRLPSVDYVVSVRHNSKVNSSRIVLTPVDEDFEIILITKGL